MVQDSKMGSDAMDAALDVLNRYCDDIPIDDWTRKLIIHLCALSWIEGYYAAGQVARKVLAEAVQTMREGL